MVISPIINIVWTSITIVGNGGAGVQRGRACGLVASQLIDPAVLHGEAVAAEGEIVTINVKRPFADYQVLTGRIHRQR